MKCMQENSNIFEEYTRKAEKILFFERIFSAFFKFCKKIEEEIYEKYCINQVKDTFYMCKMTKKCKKVIFKNIRNNFMQ